MRIALVSMMVLAVLIGGCKKNNTQQTQTSAAKNVIPMNTVSAPLTEEAAKSPDRILVETEFSCVDKTKFKARFKPDTMEINSGWSSWASLDQQPVASGFFYKNSQYQVRGKGRQAVLSIQGRKPVICTATR